MEKIECTLFENNKWGYVYTPVKCKSIAEAKRKGYDYIGGFAFRLVVNEKVVYRGYCKD